MESQERTDAELFDEQDLRARERRRKSPPPPRSQPSRVRDVIVKYVVADDIAGKRKIPIWFEDEDGGMSWFGVDEGDGLDAYEMCVPRWMADNMVRESPDAYEIVGEIDAEEYLGLRREKTVAVATQQALVGRGTKSVHGLQVDAKIPLVRSKADANEFCGYDPRRGTVNNVLDIREGHWRHLLSLVTDYENAPNEKKAEKIDAYVQRFWKQENKPAPAHKDAPEFE